jgi:hypothetical protein
LLSCFLWERKLYRIALEVIFLNSFIPPGKRKGFVVWSMPSSGMWRRVGPVRTNVLEGHVASIFRAEIIRERYCYPSANANPSSRFLPWRQRRYVPPKRLFPQDLQDSALRLVVTAVKTSNPTQNSYALRTTWERLYKSNQHRNKSHSLLRTRIIQVSTQSPLSNMVSTVFLFIRLLINTLSWSVAQ